jgi:multisubunit Na+/H+ antiporter MnhE subunit
MEYVKLLFQVRDYLIGIIYSFTFIDVTKKILFSEFYLDNATNFAQFLATLVALFFGYFKLIAYIRDSKIKTKILEQELREKELDNFYRKHNKEFIEPFKKTEDDK